MTSPRFRILSRSECDALLERSSVGRVAFVHENRVEIVPLHYVYASGVLYGRTAPGTRLERTSDNFYDSWPVAFEVDDVRGLFRWQSVVVHGNLHAAAHGGAEWRRNPVQWAEAAQAFRTLMPQAFTESDPTRFRDVLIRIDALEVSGREAIPGGESPSSLRRHA